MLPTSRVRGGPSYALVYRNCPGRSEPVLIPCVTSSMPTLACSRPDVSEDCCLTLVPRLRKIRADGAYGGEPLVEWCRGVGGWELEIAERERKARGFEVLAERWIVERTFGWLSRRLSKDCERRVQTGETMIEVATIRLLLRRLVPRT